MADTAASTAPEATPSPTEQAEAILADMGIGRDDGEAIEPEGAPPAPEAAAAPAEPAKEPAAEAAAPPVAEEWTKTPEGIAAKSEEVSKGLELLAKERSEFQRRYDQLDKREQKLRQSVDKFKQDKEQTKTFTDWVSSQVRALRTGDTSTRLQALGALTGKSAQEAYDELTLGIISDGKQAPAAKPVSEEELERRVMARLEAREAQARQQSSVQQQIQQWRETAVQVANTTATPLAARLAAADPAEYADRAQRTAEAEHAKTKQPVTPARVAVLMEQQLSKLAASLVPAQASAEGAAPLDGGTNPEIVAQAKPGTAQRPPKGSSIPQSSGGAARTRELTPEERRKKAEELVPEYALARMG